MKTHIVISFCFALLFFSINWESIRSVKFIDRDRYESNMSKSFYLSDKSKIYSISYHISNETLWNIGVRYLVFFQKIKAKYIFNFITFSIIFIYSLFILKYTNNFLYLFLLFTPIFIDFSFSQLRMGLATFFLYLLFLNIRRRFVLIFIIPIFFIHSASVLFFIIFFMTSYIYKKYENHITKLFIYNIILVFSILLILIYKDNILSYVGDRRLFVKDNSNGAFFTLFFIGLITFLLFNFSKIKEKFIFILMFNFILIFILTSFFNIYSIRYISVSLPLLIISVSELNNQMKKFILFYFFSFITIHFYLWVK